MPKRNFTTINGNEAVAHVAYHTSEVIAIYPITPSSPIGESADAWSSAGKRNGENPLQLDSRAPKIPIEQFLYLENRFKMLTKSKRRMPDDCWKRRRRTRKGVGGCTSTWPRAGRNRRSGVIALKIDIGVTCSDVGSSALKLDVNEGAPARGSVNER